MIYRHRIIEYPKRDPKECTDVMRWLLIFGNYSNRLYEIVKNPTVYIPLTGILTYILAENRIVPAHILLTYFLKT